MKSIYCIKDERTKDWIIDPMILENDIQASIAYVRNQKAILDTGVIIKDLRLYKIGKFDSENTSEPIVKIEPIEIPIEFTPNEEGNANE